MICVALPILSEFDPDRPDNEHFGFGEWYSLLCRCTVSTPGGLRIALTELARRLAHPRLVVDPPPYRANAVLRGPQHLLIAFDHMQR